MLIFFMVLLLLLLLLFGHPLIFFFMALLLFVDPIILLFAMTLGAVDLQESNAPVANNVSNNARTMDIKEEALKLFPIKLRECGDGRDENFIKRQCWITGAQWVEKRRDEQSKKLAKEREASKTLGRKRGSWKRSKV